MQGDDFTVLNTNDVGVGSLRSAITNANANFATAPHRILFNLPTNSTTIFLSNTVTIAVPMLIDGSSQPNYAGAPIVELNGTRASSANSGLTLNSSNTIVRALVINRFPQDGVTISSGRSNHVEGCYIGTDRTGTNNAANRRDGIFINASVGNVIGGTNTSQRNVIGGTNLYAAICLLDAGAPGNIILGNFIGLGADGVTRLRNQYHGFQVDNCPSNQIGGLVAGAGNVISGNDAIGVYLIGTSAKANVIQGNLIGLDATGTVVVSNGVDGITVEGGSYNQIGGTNSGARNVISGNGASGINIKAGATNNTAQGNYLGTDITGRLSRGNHLPCLVISGASNNQIGGTVNGARNVIAGNWGTGLLLSTNSSGNVVQGNLIGLDATGTNALANGLAGLAVANAWGNTIGGTVTGAGNVISGNTNHGIYMTGGMATNNLVAGNYIGTDVTGTKGIGNNWSGILSDAGGNWIGGTTAPACNVISGNAQDGIQLLGNAANNNTIQGNFIGVDVTGGKALANGLEGVRLNGSPFNTVGGSATGVGNIISGNGDVGIYVTGASTAGNAIQGNFIGTDVTGTKALGNYNRGIYLEQAVSNTIGGTLSGAGNLISGGYSFGILLTNSLWNTIQGNSIGTKVDGVSSLPNAYHGIDLQVGSSNNLIGGTAANAGNRLAFAPSPFCGVRVRDGAANNAILGNAIFSNGGLGIDISTNGVTLNDNCDPDLGGNMQQNFPVLASAIVGMGSNIEISGSLNSVANKAYRVQFFASPSCDSSGYGEGQIFLGDTLVTLGASCSLNFTNTLAVMVPVGYSVTATATDPANNTSEFSTCVRVVPLPKLALARSSTNQHQSVISWVWTNGAPTPGLVLKESDTLTRPLAQWWPVTNGIVALNSTNWSYRGMQSNANRFYKLTLP